LITLPRLSAPPKSAPPSRRLRRLTTARRRLRPRPNQIPRSARLSARCARD